MVWTLDMPVGITDRSVLHSSGWVAGNALMAVIQLVGLLLVLVLIRPWAQRLPAWLLLAPAWVGTGLLFQVVGAALVAVFSSPASGGTVEGIQSWVFVMVYSAFTGQGAALAIAFACYVRARWGRLLGARTGEVVTRRTVPVSSWPETHLAQTATAVAAMAVAVAIVWGYWTAGGSLGPSAVQPDPSSALQAARAAGAVIAAVGLLGLAGRWGRRTRLWVPATFTWIGSGAVAAFDGLTLLFFLMLRPDTAEAGWSLTDTLLVTKVAIGVSAGVVGALAVTAAAKDDKNSERARHLRPAPAGSSDLDTNQGLDTDAPTAAAVGAGAPSTTAHVDSSRECGRSLPDASRSRR